MKFTKSIVAVSLTLCATAFAAPKAETPPGEVQSSFDSPNAISEFCSLPRILDAKSTLESGTPAFSPFSAADLKSTKKVCAADFYDNRESTDDVSANVVRPKLGSTNPAILIHELPKEMTRAKYLAQECRKEKQAGDVVAKFKQSVSCSNTGAILSYPRIARILDSQIEFPFSAYRSMDRREHLELAALGKALSTALNGKSAIITQTWSTILSDDSNPSHSSRRSSLFKEEDSILYGALVPDVKGEEIYYAANGSTVGDRVAKFQLTVPFARVSKATPVSAWGLSKDFTAENVQEMILLREEGDLIVLDTLLNQQDRFGNLHYREYYVRMAEDGSLDWILAKKKKDAAPAAKKAVFVPDEKQKAELSAKGYVRVRRMLLKDNDCGVSKENKMALANGGKGIAPLITHLHPDTYVAIQRLQKLARHVGRNPSVLEGYLKSELTFSASDVIRVEANLNAMADQFRSRCLGGKLFLDADIAQILGSKPAVNSVEFCKQVKAGETPAVEPAPVDPDPADSPANS